MRNSIKFEITIVFEADVVVICTFASHTCMRYSHERNVEESYQGPPREVTVPDWFPLPTTAWPAPAATSA